MVEGVNRMCFKNYYVHLKIPVDYKSNERFMFPNFSFMLKIISVFLSQLYRLKFLPTYILLINDRYNRKNLQISRQRARDSGSAHGHNTLAVETDHPALQQTASCVNAENYVVTLQNFCKV